MIGELLAKVLKVLMKNKATIQKGGQEAIKFYGKHQSQINAGIKIAALVVMQYNTYRAQKYEKELQEQYKKYKKDNNEQYKTAAKSIFDDINSVIKKANLTQNEKDELNDILKRHAAWIGKGKKKTVAKQGPKKGVPKEKKPAAKKVGTRTSVRTKPNPKK